MSTYLWLWNIVSSAQTTVLAPALLILPASKPAPAGMFVYLGNRPDGAQKAEGTKKGNAGISPGPRSRGGDESWADGPEQTMWEAGLQENCGHNVAWLKHGFAQLATRALLPSSILTNPLQTVCFRCDSPLPNKGAGMWRDVVNNY